MTFKVPFDQSWLEYWWVLLLVAWYVPALLYVRRHGPVESNDSGVTPLLRLTATILFPVVVVVWLLRFVLVDKENRK